MALLQTAAAESEEKSEEVAQKFRDKEIQIEDFLEQFTSARKEMHARKLKAEKMVEIMRQQQQQPANGGPLPYNRPAPIYPGSNFYPPAPGAVPYPTGPYAMPMPPNPMFRRY